MAEKLARSNLRDPRSERQGLYHRSRQPH